MNIKEIPLDSMVNGWPYKIGDTPFHVKGVAMTGCVNYLKQTIPNGLDCVEDEAVRTYLSQKFMDSFFYDIHAINIGVYYGAKVLKKDFYVYSKEAGLFQMANDLKGIYGVFFKILSANVVINSIALVVNKYFDYGPASAEKHSGNSGTFIRKEMPVQHLPFYAPLVEGYIEKALEKCGVKNIKTVSDYTLMNQKKDNVDLTELRVTATWS